jgi:hypothetical protein
MWRALVGATKPRHARPPAGLPVPVLAALLPRAGGQKPLHRRFTGAVPELPFPQRQAPPPPPPPRRPRRRATPPPAACRGPGAKRAAAAARMKRVVIGLVGPGLIGKALVQQLAQQVGASQRGARAAPRVPA